MENVKTELPEACLQALQELDVSACPGEGEHSDLEDGSDGFQATEVKPHSKASHLF